MSERNAPEPMARLYGNDSEPYTRNRKHQLVLSCPECKFYCAAEWTPHPWPGPGATSAQIEEYQRSAASRGACVAGAEISYRSHSCEDSR